MTQLIIPLAAPFHENNMDGLPIEINEFQGKMTAEIALEPFLNSKLIKKIIIIIHSPTSDKNGLDKVMKSLVDKRLVIKKIYNYTAGATCTSLMSLDEIDYNEPLIISSLDQLVSIKMDKVINYFINTDCDGGLVIFNSRNPRWSYALISEDRVQQTAEKNPISNNAIAGIYFFKNGLTFKRAGFDQIFKRANQPKGEFYLSGIYNELIISNKVVIPYKISSENYIKFLSKDVLVNYILNSKENQNSTFHLTSSTYKYVDAFNNKNINQIENIFHKNAVLDEVKKSKFDGINNISKLFEELFKNEVLKLDVINIEIALQTQTSIIEFNLELNDRVFHGVDIINWEYNKIKRLTAYFFESSDEV